MSEEFKEFLESEEGQKFLDNALSEKVKENGYKSQEEVQGLVNKNKELLGKVKKAKDSSISEDSKKLLNMLNEHEITDEEELSNFLEKSTESTKGSDDLGRQFKRLQKDFENLTTQLNMEKERANMEHEMRISSEQKVVLTTALKKAGVKENAFDMTYAYFNGLTAKEMNEDGSFSFVAKDAEGLSPDITKYIDEWSQSDNAKEFIQQPINQGAGNPLGGNSKGTTITRADFNNKSPDEQATIATSGSISIVD